jgi:hypothetical protein
MAASPPTSAAATYSERLWFGPTGWTAVVMFAVVLVVALYPFGTGLAVAVGVVALVAGLAVAAAWAARVRVAGGELWAGPAHLPLHLAGDVRPLDAAAAREELGPRLDARAYVCLRAWARTAVRVEVVDPADPTPYWLVSTRHPEALAAAIVAGRGRPAARDV